MDSQKLKLTIHLDPPNTVTIHGQPSMDFPGASRTSAPTSIEMLADIFAGLGLHRDAKWLLLQLDPPHEEKVRLIVSIPHNASTVKALA